MNEFQAFSMYSVPGSGMPVSLATGSWTPDNGISSWTPNVDVSAAEHAFKIHRQACKLHEEGLITCYGSLRRRQKSSCLKKATSFFDGVMPTCKLHQDQIIQASRCKVPLPCGRYCGRLCEWLPHSLQRCAAHYDHPMPCYFLNIPLELRTRIYDMLLPNQDVPALQGSGALRADGKPCSLAILRVNQQIHDEATRSMYSLNTFIVNLSQQGLSMCNGRVMQTNPPNSSGMGNHALQDYQMQLMLLEQQNKRRLLIARRQSDAAQSSSQLPPPLNPVAAPLVFNNQSQGWPQPGAVANYYNPMNLQFETSPFDRTWTAPLSTRYFNLIRSFRTSVCFPGIPSPDRYIEHRPHLQSQCLYSLNDQLHRLISRFELSHRPLTRLEIDLHLSDAYCSLDEAVSAADVLLRPFRRLCGVGNATVRSITMKNPIRYQNHFPGSDDIDLLIPDATHSNTNLLEYLHSFSLALRSPSPSLPPSSLFEGYWKLSILLDKLSVHCNAPTIFKGDDELKQGIVGFKDLKHRARVAREDGDEKGFREVFEVVLDLWQRYLNWEKEFQRDTWGDIQDIWGVFGDEGRWERG